MCVLTVVWIYIDILFNAQKSCLFKVGTAYKDHIGNLKIGEQIIKWGDSLQYLGVHFVSARVMTVDIHVCVQIRKFYAAANSILHHSMYVSEIARLSLVESYALPMFLRFLICVHINYVVWPCVGIVYLESFFKFHRWESDKLVQFILWSYGCFSHV